MHYYNLALVQDQSLYVDIESNTEITETQLILSNIIKNSVFIFKKMLNSTKNVHCIIHKLRRLFCNKQVYI